MIEQGVDIYTVKEFLGHKTLAMTETLCEGLPHQSQGQI